MGDLSGLLRPYPAPRGRMFYSRFVPFDDLDEVQRSWFASQVEGRTFRELCVTCAGVTVPYPEDLNTADYWTVAFDSWGRRPRGWVSRVRNGLRLRRLLKAEAV